MEELAKTYNPKETEDKIYKLWEKADAFSPLKRYTLNATPYCIVIPPPNVTGSLHMGHALNNTIQDILIRRARMKGIPTLWVPGTDHAGIATQNVVEKQLAKEGKTRKDLGREAFEKEVWRWVNKYGHIIIDQLKKLGCSCDWSRQRFTMDKDYSKAVQAAFKHYLDKGWIYQGERVINWCVHCQTALSDIEVEHREQNAQLYFFRYDKNFPITIATTRPETKLGDTAVAVNPKDSRYQDFIGKTFKINFASQGREIEVIADPTIDPKFGSGAVGLTPAHSLIDAELAEKNNLKAIKIIDQYGRMTKEAGPEYEGLKTNQVREKILEWLKKEKLLEKEEDITHNLSVCYRCGRQIEPQPSKQWFLKMKELAKPAIAAVENDEIKFTPARWKKVYLDWMENLKDWCISRQIWWGHKIPIKGSSDVLDTWFSSALWPIAVFLKKNGSKSKCKMQNAKLRKTIDIFGEDLVTDDLADFYPTTILSTARDIIYLWVARMIFSGFEFTGQKPFSEVYIHPTIFNIEGKRMSKSLGTGVDPLQLIEKYGADATRFGLTFINTGTQDIKFDEKAILASQKFANKIWNIARFIIMNLEISKSKFQISNEARNPNFKIDSKLKIKNLKLLTDADRQITQSLNHLITSVDQDLDNFRFGQAAHSLYDFIWHDFADQYIESSKLKAQSSKPKKNNPEILLYVLTTSLKLLHPLMPYLTESIWQTLLTKNLVDEKMLILAKWPTVKS